MPGQHSQSIGEIESKRPCEVTPLSLALGVNAITICDCGGTFFKIGVAVNLDNGNNFIRLLECADCGHQMPATHKSDADLAPSIGIGAHQ